MMFIMREKNEGQDFERKKREKKTREKNEGQDFLSKKTRDKMQAWGDERIKKIVVVLAAEGIKISITSDIWYSYSYVYAYFLQYTF